MLQIHHDRCPICSHLPSVRALGIGLLTEYHFVQVSKYYKYEMEAIGISMGEVRCCVLPALGSFTYQLGSELISCESLTKEGSPSAIP